MMVHADSSFQARDIDFDTQLRKHSNMHKVLVFSDDDQYTLLKNGSQLKHTIFSKPKLTMIESIAQLNWN